jgi:hypothetical protein
MYGRAVERIVAVFDSKKTGGLLNVLSRSRRFREAEPRPEGSMLIAKAHDTFGNPVSNSRYVLHRSIEAVLRSTPTRFTTFHRTCQTVFQFSLIDVVLVLPNSNRFRFELHQFRQRVLEPPAMR